MLIIYFYVSRIYSPINLVNIQKFIVTVSAREVRSISEIGDDDTTYTFSRTLLKSKKNCFDLRNVAERIGLLKSGIRHRYF